jgi:hypothetical protein
VLLVPFGNAIAHHPDHRSPHAYEGDSTSEGTHQHGDVHGHLPATRKNVKLIGELEPTDEFGPIAQGQIADLAVYKDHAYLNSWSEPTCTKGGVYVVDIRDPRNPEEVAFIPALSGNYHGEGAHVISVATKSFTGDLLAVNNEFCDDAPTVGGGFDLYDVTNPASPQVLIQGAGDFGDEGRMKGSLALPRDYHSVFMWQDDGKVYLVGTDNVEFHDVDIFDITNPRSPKPVGEYDMLDLFPQIAETPAPNGNNVFNHDMVVKVVDGRDVLLDSYWDGGYLLIDVENPAKPTYIGDQDFGPTDPLGVLPNNAPPEGNAHQAEFSHDNTYFLAADEDFNPYRADKFFLEDATGSVERPAAEVGGGQSVASLPDQTLSGKVVYGGYGCPADTTVVPKAADYDATELGLQTGDEKILLMQRGPSGDPSADYNGNGDLTDDACFPGEKAAKAFDAGWDALVLVNRHTGSATSDTPFCGSGAYEDDKPMVTICTTHAAYHELFGTTPEFGFPYSSTDAPAIGTISSKRVRATSKFDGWGYAHLYEVGPGKVHRVDSYAIPEATDPAYAFGFGDLSIHEFATDPERNRAYISYYSGGVRVVEFGPGGITEVGRYIDKGGNNFWGVETFVPGNAKAGDLQGKRLFAGSDRDHGIFIFQYTGK